MTAFVIVATIIALFLLTGLVSLIDDLVKRVERAALALEEQARVDRARYAAEAEMLGDRS